MSQPSPDAEPSDCINMLASESAIHTAMILDGSSFAMPFRLSTTESVFSAARISSPGLVSSNTCLISGLIDKFSTPFVYCSKKPVSWFAAACDSSVNSVSLDVIILQPTIQMATAATTKNTRITLLPICFRISSAIRLRGFVA